MVEGESPKKRVRRKKVKVVDSENVNNKELVRQVKSNILASRPPEVAKRVRVYRNGDAYHKGINFVLNVRQDHTIHTFLDVISERIGLIQGAKRLYTVDGVLICSTHDLQSNNEYVASSGSFLPLAYGKLGGGTRRASFSATNVPTKEGTPFNLHSTPKKTSSMPTPSRPSRSLEPRNRATRQSNQSNGTYGHLKGLHSPADRNPKRTSALSGESSMNNLGFSGLEIEAKSKPKEKKKKKVVSNSEEPGKENKKVKADEIEREPTPVATEVGSSSPPASVPATIQSISRNDSMRQESGIFTLGSREDKEEDQQQLTRDEEEKDELLNGYHNANQDGEEKVEKQEEINRSQTPKEVCRSESPEKEEQRNATPEQEKECRSPNPADKKEEEGWSPAPGEYEKHFTDSEDERKQHKKVNESGEETENLAEHSAPEAALKEKSHEEEHHEKQPEQDEFHKDDNPDHITEPADNEKIGYILSSVHDNSLSERKSKERVKNKKKSVARKNSNVSRKS